MLPAVVSKVLPPEVTVEIIADVVMAEAVTLEPTPVAEPPGPVAVPLAVKAEVAARLDEPEPETDAQYERP